MNPFETPFDRLSSVDAPAKPARNAVWWINFTIHSCAGIAVAYVVLALIIGG